ncbi:MAG TPA: FGGY-family carbohydrate kinase [Acidimicrobiales bacterium]|nr:FGGY-family carbohydrate kinase [Acidimicrobiales bacterium]
MKRVLVVDVGTSSVRSSVVDENGKVAGLHQVPTLPASPEPGQVEFDPHAVADAARHTALEALRDAGASGVDAVGITNQRASTVVWDRMTGKPVGPGIGWQDLRTVVDCLVLQGQGIRVAPNVSATKVGWLLNQFDAERDRDLCFGTVDSWIAWSLSGGDTHVIDATNAGVTGMVDTSVTRWDDAVLSAIGIQHTLLPTIVDTAGVCGTATFLPGHPPIAALVGDQQASLVGQGCVQPGVAKITFGTGGMLDVVTGFDRPTKATRSAAGCFPIVAWRHAGETVWGLEGVMLSAGTCVEWLRDDLGVIATAEESDAVAASVADTGDVWFVPALLGLGTPEWDFGARGGLFGLTRGSTRAHVVRAVLEGIAHRGADLVEAAEADFGQPLRAIHVDGGMSGNATFVQALADACGRPIEVSPEREATTLGAAYLALVAIGAIASIADLAARWQPSHVVTPSGRPSQRDRWKQAVARAAKTIPELSGVEF